VLLHQLRKDFVLALELGFELFDLFVLGVLDGLGLAAVVIVDPENWTAD
jgi:hypothetical protein